MGATAVFEGIVCLARNDSSSLGAWLIGVLMAASGVALEIGALTPISGAVVALGNVAIAAAWLGLPASAFFHNGFARFYVIIMAAITCLLGPGAYSLDARMFGRREIVIPPSSHSDKL